MGARIVSRLLLMCRLPISGQLALLMSNGHSSGTSRHKTPSRQMTIIAKYVCLKMIASRI
jgi:hypothetical protein